jgi:hydantoinase/carbamoylase family amidase
LFSLGENNAQQFGIVSAMTDALQPARAVADLRELRELTEDSRGAQRVAWTETWARARDWLGAKLEELPVEVERDEAGNLWATLRGASERRLLLGGHIDSVPDGGWLDGSLGTVGGLEVLRGLASAGEPPLTVSLVDWADEEGARFGQSLLGSSLAAGAIDYDDVAGMSDRDGVSLPDAMAAHGVDLRRAAEGGARLDGATAYLELHIEQGPVLEREGLALAAVTGTAGVERHTVRFRGESVQGGGFPMTGRRDALAAAARFVLEVRASVADESGRATAGDVRVRPGIPTAVAGEATVVIDERHPDAGELAAMLRRTREASERIADEEGVSLEWETIWRIDPVPFDPRLIELAEDAVEEVAGTRRRLFSGAIHDAAATARHGVPTVMVFVQSLRGLSHNKEEDTTPEHLELAVRALDRLASRVIA